MEESDEPTKPDPKPPTPEVDHLIKMLELQTEMQRAKRGGRPELPAGMQFRWVSLAVIIIFAVGSVVFMEFMVSQLPKPGGATVENSSEMKPAISGSVPQRPRSTVDNGENPGKTGQNSGYKK